MDSQFVVHIHPHEGKARINVGAYTTYRRTSAQLEEDYLEESFRGREAGFPASLILGRKPLN
ncbi:hypothetical protein D9M69_582150 [compost metagenome]